MGVFHYLWHGVSLSDRRRMGVSPRSQARTDGFHSGGDRRGGGAFQNSKPISINCSKTAY